MLSDSIQIIAERYIGQINRTDVLGWNAMNKNRMKNENVDLLVALKRHDFLADYNLALYCRQDEGTDKQKAQPRQCGSIQQNSFSSKMILPFLAKEIETALDSGKPAVYRLHGGLLSFLLPFRAEEIPCCLVGEGVREKTLNILKMKELCQSNQIDVFELLEQIEKLPVKSYGEVEEVVGQTRRALLAIQGETNYKTLFYKSRRQLTAITRSLAQLEEVKTPAEIVKLCGELLSTLFNFSKIAVALREEKDKELVVQGAWGLVGELGRLPENSLSVYISQTAGKKTVKLDGDLRTMLPMVEANCVTCFPLQARGATLGFVALFDVELQGMDAQLMELITSRMSTRIMQLKKGETRPVDSSTSNLMSFTNTLLFAESKEELYKSVLEIAADLVGASRGSVMLVDESGERLQIGFCKGMNQNLAQSITVKVGEGIAGKVASSGVPLLVDDIEKDNRVGMRNRPRFKTKSLLSVPLKLKDRLIGVLNLSDKENLGVFSEADLDLLASFAHLASLMIERSWAMERSSILEKLSVTDHLTGLYNHRFLRSRLEEELNRSTRQGLKLTIIFLDLDFFKIYNDLCGHLAGDIALRKTADILKGSVRDMDTVVRYGGEEFCVVLPDTDKEEALVVAERIRQEIEKEKFASEEHMPFGRLTASFGISSFPEDGHTFTTLMHSADVALYKAKADGRNRVILSQPAMLHGSA